MKRSELVRRTPLRAKAGLKSRSVPAKSAPKKRTYRRTGPAPAVVALVFDRDGGRCVRCGAAVRPADRGVGWSVQHRRARAMGSSRRPETNLPANLIILCGSATTGCHQFVESSRTAALLNGWALLSTDTPSSVPVHTWWGLVILDDEGRWTEVPS